MMEPKPIDLYEFLVDSELQHYYNSIKNDLKISMVSHLKYASDEDLKQLGLSKPEIRRLRKYYDKVYPNGYLSKIKRLLQNPVKKDDGTASLNTQTKSPISDPNILTGIQLLHPTVSLETLKVSSSPSKIPNNKHIIPADSICVNKQLGTGEFGIVQQGVWTNGTERIQVAIKCLCRERMQSNPMEFLKEAAIMHSIEHENIVRLYGVVLDTDSLMLVTELAHLRSLLECLKDSGLRVSFLTVPTLCEFAHQICNGMMYLENKRLIHRDLAARNILVFSKNKVKISDFGLSRALGVGKDYYQTNFNINLKLPIAWCAPECINFLRFTNASDVWAFGVCLWEMFSYGFQPWAALTGHQILEAIDEPNYQRLEAPECCPREYYNLMLKCWQHDPLKRPKFTDIYTTLPDMKPEQLKTIQSYGEAKKDHLNYRQNDIISVLDKSSNSPYWKGVLNSGKTGLFNPANTVTYLGSLPSSTNPNRDSFCRTSERTSKRKLRTEMISMPHNDLKHTGHVGLDGAFFGDVANFMSSPNSSQSYNHVPRQIVTPYKPSEDIEQTPLLLPPTPTSPDSLQTASGYFPDANLAAHAFVNTATVDSVASATIDNFGSSFNFNSDPTAGGGNFSSSNPFVGHEHVQQNTMRSTIGSFNNANVDDDGCYSKDQPKKPNTIIWPEITTESSDTHEYHEISDDEMTTEKVFDLGPSLLDEMDFMFRSMNAAAAAAASTEQEPKSPGFDNTNKKNEITELTSKLHCRKNAATGVSSTLGMTSKSKKKPGTVKPISHKDERILNQAIDYANEISARSMTDLLTDTPVAAQSPKRKFSFRFPNLSHHNSMDKESHANGNHSTTGTLTHKGRNFSEEIKNVPDLQNTITDESRAAYNSLVEKPSPSSIKHMEFDNSKLDPMHNVLRPLCGTASTLPREAAIGHPIDTMNKPKTFELSVPTHKAPRPTTLPYRSAQAGSISSSSKSPDVDSNPLRILRDKNYPIVRPRLKATATVLLPSTSGLRAGSGAPVDTDSCESPSYLANTEYTFSERDVNIHRGESQKPMANKEIENLNPIPLPPRDRNKVMQTNVKRHVRKYPLIIPVSALQRTLNKVISPVEEKVNTFSPFTNATDPSDGGPSAAREEVTQYGKKFVENYFPPNNGNRSATTGCSTSSTERTYENLDTLRYQMQDCTDSASLHFESILEDDCNKYDEMQSPDVTNDFMFEIHKDHYRKPSSAQLANETDESRNLDIEKKKLEFSHRHPKYVQPKNELADNLLFNKIKETVESVTPIDVAAAEPTKVLIVSQSYAPLHSAASAEHLESYDEPDGKGVNSSVDIPTLADDRKLEDSNSVSCEDLLEFSDKKPKGRERGVESDEVRIMAKVLGVVASPDQFIEALDVIDWDVHKAIKLIMLQKTLSTSKLSLQECVDALQKNEWDMQTTTLRLKGL